MSVNNTRLFKNQNFLIHIKSNVAFMKRAKVLTKCEFL